MGILAGKEESSGWFRRKDAFRSGSQSPREPSDEQGPGEEEKKGSPAMWRMEMQPSSRQQQHGSFARMHLGSAASGGHRNQHLDMAPDLHILGHTFNISVDRRQAANNSPPYTKRNTHHTYIPSTLV